mgnify:FL=1|jgi:hypothetical protein
MYPESDHLFHADCDNGFVGDVTTKVLGVSACLYAFSNLSFSDHKRLSELCTQHYHWLREFVPEMGEEGQILAMCD